MALPKGTTISAKTGAITLPKATTTSKTTTLPKATTPSPTLPVPVYGTPVTAGYPTGVSAPAKFDPNTGAALPNTPGSAYGTLALPTFEDPKTVAARNKLISYAGDQANTNVNENSIRNDVLNQFQAEIDAQNSVYTDKLNQAKIQGQGRIGSDVAVQARRGLLGSDFGTAQGAGVVAGNTAIENQIRNEQAAAVQGILSTARQAAAQQIKEKQAAKAAGLQSYLAYLSEGDTRRTNNASSAAKTLIGQGLAPEKISPSELNALATGYGITVDAIKDAYLNEKRTFDEAQLKTKLETDKSQAEIDKFKTDQQNIDRKFEEDKRQFGLEYALKAKQTAIDQQNADTAASKVGAGTSITTASGQTYTPGQNTIVDSWANRIQNGSAKITEIPSTQVGLRNAVSVALDAMGNAPDGKPTTTELGKASLVVAKDLLTKFNAGQGTVAVGKSRNLGGGLYGSFTSGTDASNLVNDFNSLKSQLSLEGVKYLKGQGAVSDAERALLAQAVTKLNLSQSEDEFKTTLQGIIDKLEGHVRTDTGTAGGDITNIVTAPDGAQVEITD